MHILNDKVLYFHIPKTAGTSISKEFTPHSNIKKIMPLGMHVGLPEAIKRWPDYDFLNYKHIAITRNPWERMASFYVHNYSQFADDPPRDLSDPIFFFFNRGSTWVNIFDCLTLNGELQEGFTFIRFTNLKEDLNSFWRKEFNGVIKIPHINVRESEYDQMYKDLISKKDFQEFIAEKAEREINMFGYTVPEIS